MKCLLLFFILIQCSYSSEWKYIETYEGVKLYELSKSDEYATPFRAIGTVNASLEEIVKALVDVDRKNQWAPKLKSVNLHRVLKANEFIFRRRCKRYYT